MKAYMAEMSYFTDPLLCPLPKMFQVLYQPHSIDPVQHYFFSDHTYDVIRTCTGTSWNGDAATTQLAQGHHCKLCQLPMCKLHTVTPSKLSQNRVPER